MKIVLLEPLGISEKKLSALVRPFLDAGHAFVAMPESSEKADWLREAKDADVVVIGNKPLPGEFISQCEKLKFISVAFTGFDHIDIEQCRKQGIAVSNASGYANTAVAETTIGLMISTMRRFKETEERCRTGGTKDGLVGPLLAGKTVGVIGTGAIGSAVIKLLNAFGCRVLGYSPSEKSPEEVRRVGYEKVSLEQLLAESDVVTLHCPLNDSTRGMIGANELASMKDGAYLFNLARGPVVDSQALAVALNSGKLAGAGVDVYEIEPPLPVDHPLLKAKNIVTLPHIAWYSHQSLELRAEIAFDNVREWMAGCQQNKVI
ncbi:MAG: NAD(P)-dependent oxidoreductase [Candidatus Wallacebacter cryptica]|jgi:phosphoglycerate dehydrogenase-like enzyme|nr:hydroxyacid dehydrogenase [Bacillota bacterium]